MFDDRRDRTRAEAAAVEQIRRAERRWPGYYDTARRTTLNAHYTDPAIIAAAWQFLRQVGISDGHLGWEPGAGTGLWMADPAAAPMHGVELDPVSAAIGNHLLPDRSRIVHGNLTAATLPPDGAGADGYDFVAGNVPFAAVAPHAADNPDRLPLHTYALTKAASFTRPGGYLAVLTSRYTLDAHSPAGREALARHVNLVAAVRLPTGAHAEMAGTEVVTDLLLMHKPVDPADLRPWPDVVPIDVEATTVAISEHYTHHPDRILGTLALAGMRHRADLRVLHDGARDGSYIEGLRTRLDDVAATAPPATPTGRVQPAAGAAPRSELPPGSIVITAAGDFVRHTVDGPEPMKVPRTQHAELVALCELRDLTRTVLGGDAAGTDTTADRGDLNRAYDRYLERWGPLNRYSTAARQAVTADPDAPDDAVAKHIYPRLGGFRADPGWWSVAALEVFDDETGTATKAPFLHRPVLTTAEYPAVVTDPADAIAVLVARDGTLTPAAVAELADIDPADVDDWLGDHAFRDANDELIPAARYLSGNVRDKLTVAEAAADTDPRWQRNVAALRAVQPALLTHHEITPRFGATWIPVDQVRQFCAETLNLAHVTVAHTPETATWAVEANGYSVENVYTYGVDGRRTACDLVEDLCNQRATRITRIGPDDRRVLDLDATAAASAKRGELEDSFRAWLFSEPTRTDRLVADYNRRFNSHVEPRWDGAALQFHGLANTFKMRPHQRDAVARILGDRDRGTLLAHAVGAGKTAVMSAAAMELRRLGIAGGPVAIVVPNSMLTQFAREFLQLYPQAAILVAEGESFSTDRRREFVARAASGAYDVVLFSHTSFTAVPLTPETIAAHTSHELAVYRDAMARATSDGSPGRSVKQLETLIARTEERLHKLNESAHRDAATVNFEALGVGHLMVDEAHLAKNLSFPTRIDSVQVRESARARDLLMKADWLRDRRGPGAVTFATATPVTNQLSELWVFQRFLDPAAQRSAGVDQFDAWAATFAATVNAVEIAPSGVGYRQTTRFARFTNVPELSASFRAYADVRTPAELALPRPAVRGGRATIVELDGGPDMEAFMNHLLERSRHLSGNAYRAEPGADNVLAIASDGRVGALDLRLATRTTGYGPPVGPSPKIERAADEIAGRYRANLHRSYLQADGTPSPIRGATQIVFCDHGVPGNPHHNVYDDLTQALVERGVPRHEVAYVQDAANHDERGRLFGAVRDGRVKVLVGSTASMGVGVNVQTRLIASHILTPPWRPDEVEQGEGRTLRQGNQNPEVELLRYVTRGSYDAYTWQTIERKSRFIGQIMTAPGQLARDVIDQDAVADEYAILKAVAAGDPRILAAAQLHAQLTALERADAVHRRTAATMRNHLDRTTTAIASHQAALEVLPHLLTSHDPGYGIELLDVDGRPMRTLPPGTTGTAEDLTTHLRTVAERRLHSPQRAEPCPLARVDGIPLTLRLTNTREPIVEPQGVDHPLARRDWPWLDVARTAHQLSPGPGTAILNLARSLPAVATRLDDACQEAMSTRAQLVARIDAPFPRHAELVDLRVRYHTLQAELAEDPAEAGAPVPAAASPAPRPPLANRLDPGPHRVPPPHHRDQARGR